MLIRRLFDNGTEGGGGTNPDEQNRRVQPGDAGYDRELDRARQEAIDRRRESQELKARLDQFEADKRTAAEAAAAEQGRFKELYETSQKEVETLKAQVASQSTELETLRTGAKAIETSRRKELLDRLPEDVRKEYQGDDVTIAEIERAVKLVPAAATHKTNSSGSGSINDEIPLDKKEFGELTPDDLDQLRDSHPDRYQEYLMFKINPPKKKNLFGR